MVMVYASIGSNIDRHKHIQAAINALAARYGQVESSAVYETEAVGFGGDPFFNLVSKFETDEAPEDVNRFFKQTEEQWGRERGGEKYSSRTLDIDLILYGDLVSQDNGLKLPRDEIEKYAFVLEPLAELLPEGVYARSGETYERMWKQAVDAGVMTPASRLDWTPRPGSENNAQ